MFAVLLIVSIVLASDSWPLTSVAAAFYRAGALVFGGGHVVLPLLQESVVDPGWVDADDFLAGYGASTGSTRADVFPRSLSWSARARRERDPRSRGLRVGNFSSGVIARRFGVLPFCGARRMRSCVDFVVRYDECVIGCTREVRR